MLTRFRWWWKVRRMTPAERAALDKKLSIATIRLHMRALGYDIEDLTDEEVEAGVQTNRATCCVGWDLCRGRSGCPEVPRSRSHLVRSAA